MTETAAESEKVIQVVRASAGTGKTFRLANLFVDAVERSGCGHCLDPAQIMVTTFTNKAGDDIIDRIRRRLITEGEWEAAQSVLAGYVGTVNSVCGRLIAEFALDAGISPLTDVLAEERTNLAFAVAAEPVIVGYFEDLEPIAHRLSQDDWRNLVLEVSRLARSNGITPERLRTFASPSWSGLRALLPQALDESEEALLDERLAVAIRSAVVNLSLESDSAKITNEAVNELKRCESMLRVDQLLPWADWAKLSKLKGARSLLK